jgi:DNA segregation ATPase FtsK/SpoIIIE, S-DNA-T family
MAPKTKGKPAPKGKAAKHGASGSFEIFKSPSTWWTIFTVIVIALLIVFRQEALDFFKSVRSGLGLGSIFILVFILTFVVLAIRRSLSTFVKHWNIWLGSIAFVFAVWGILGFIEDTSKNFPHSMGGLFGYYLVGGPSPFNTTETFIGSLIIVAFIILGFLLVAPKITLKVFSKLFHFIKGTPKKPATPQGQQMRNGPPAKNIVERQVQRQIPLSTKPQQPAEREESLAAPDFTKKMKKLQDQADKAAALKATAEKTGETPVKEKPAKTETVKLDPSKSETSKGDLKQVAEDVWKKYGQAGNLVEVDGWHLPPVSILDENPDVQFTDTDNQQRARLIEDTLRSYGVDASVVEINAGPTITQFGVEPGWDVKYREVKQKDKDGNTEVFKEEVSRTRVKVERINSLSNDISLALAAPTIRIEAPVPGKSFVGVEVPNVTSDMVSLRGVLETQAFQKLVAKTKMAIALGKGAGGDSVAADLTKMPHLLVAGATGSGKTVCLNTIVCCLIMNNTPNDVRFILVDPKRVELVQYNSIPHLATPVIVETSRALSALRWLCQEMDERYKKFAIGGARNIEGFNKNKTGSAKMPYLVLVIDELADLMMAGFDEVETNLCRLAQLARATGIHLVVATQRPSVDVVTGLIKANFPTRISFAVTSQVDSRTILDGVGAEKLLGKGDMLYMPTDAAKPRRLQGCFMSDAEIERIVYFWGSQQKEEPDQVKMETLLATTPNGTIGGHPRDSLLEQAKELAKTNEDVSTSFLQRRLHIGYPRAARLKEQLDAVLSKENGDAGDDGGADDSGDVTDESGLFDEGENREQS